MPDNFNPADHIIAHSRALVRAIEALGTIEPTGPIERALAGLLLVAWFTLLLFVGQQVGMTLQGRPGAALLALAVTVWPVGCWRGRCGG